MPICPPSPMLTAVQKSAARHHTDMVPSHTPCSTLADDRQHGIATFHACANPDTRPGVHVQRSSNAGLTLHCAVHSQAPPSEPGIVQPLSLSLPHGGTSPSQPARAAARPDTPACPASYASALSTIWPLWRHTSPDVWLRTAHSTPHTAHLADHLLEVATHFP